MAWELLAPRKENVMNNKTAIKNKNQAVKLINERLTDLQGMEKLFGSMKKELPELKVAEDKLQNGFTPKNEDKFWGDVPNCGLAWDWAKKIIID
jgi:hypothetical protein